ncbi:MAG: hypothetical protein K9L17_10725 [Clostridiales bacterium]|nr:hypothetical protein [Clostridiales bacterium]MCF8023154.1 hypothetical protein [Clostridiales bacterium]
MFLKNVSSNLIAACLAVLCVTGAIRVIFDVGQWIYVVLAFILCTICTYSCMGNMRLKKSLVMYFFIVNLFVTWLVFTLSWTCSSVQWKEYLQLLIFLIFVVAMILILVDRNIIHKFLVILSFLGLGIGIYVIMESGGIYEISGYNTQVNESYLTLATPIGMSFIITTIFAIYSKKHKFFWVIAAIFSMIALSLSLARGTLIFSIFVLCLLPVLHFSIGEGENYFKLIKEIGIRYLFFVLPLLGGLLFLALNVERTASRLKRMLTPFHELMAGGRGELWSNSWQAISSSPLFGYGLGSNGIFSAGNEWGYPHNFLLQVWLDGGLIAVLLAILILLLPLWYLLKALKQKGIQPYLLSLFSTFILLILEYSKSYDFYSSRAIFIIGTISIVYCFSFINEVKFKQLSDYN